MAFVVIALVVAILMAITRDMTERDVSASLTSKPYRCYACQQWRAEAKRCKAITDSLHAKRVPAKDMADEQREEVAQAITDRISAIAKAQEAETIGSMIEELLAETENTK